ncbi:MAG TPA: type II toxin-antitoxin system RelE/ParE family toxin [Opitutaceae bacterium]
MPLEIVQHPDATAELIGAARFYNGKVPTLGIQFLDAVDEAVAVIATAPTRWSIVEEDVRRYLIPRFPFAIYYRVLPDQIRILSFKHHSRHPDYWRYRTAR